MIYRALFIGLFQRIGAERAHSLALRALGLVGSTDWVRRMLRRILGPNDEILRIEALGQSFASPLGAAGGMDKNAEYFDSLEALGFGFVEIGTVTPSPQKGQDQPRVFRSYRDRAILNRMGFPNDGAIAVRERLSRRSHEARVAASIGKSTFADPPAAAEEYRRLAFELGPHCDFLVINVSSPNTPGLTAMQTGRHLRDIAEEVQAGLAAAEAKVPALVKLSPDLSDAALDALADTAVDVGLDGIVATNTTSSRAEVTHVDWSEETGGVCGRPLAKRSLQVLRRLYARVGSEILIISVGGIEDADDAWERICAGATLLQSYSGFVYGGPLWPRRINQGLKARARRAGFSRIADAIGSELLPEEPDYSVSGSADSRGTARPEAEVSSGPVHA